MHALPVRQRAHMLPNRLTGAIKRYGGAKNAFTDEEWQALLAHIGPELDRALPGTGEIRQRAVTHSYRLCGECHEEILAEPVYLPSVMEVVAQSFRGASRVEKVLTLTRMLKLGAEALARDR